MISFDNSSRITRVVSFGGEVLYFLDEHCLYIIPTAEN